MDIYPCAKFYCNSFTGRLAPKYVKYYAFVTFFIVLSCFVLVVLFFAIAPRSNWTDFNRLWLK